MIVNCPKCKFEQPNDEYCAQCGGPLRKLVEIEKQKKQNATNAPIYITTFIFFIAAGIWLSTQFNKDQENFEYENQQSQQKNLEQNDTTPSKVVVSLKSAKIKIDKDKLQKETATGSKINKVSELKLARTDVIKNDSFPKIKNQSLDSSIRPVQAVNEENPSRVQERDQRRDRESSGRVTFQKLSILYTKNCGFNIEPGSLNQENLLKIKSCSSVISTKSFKGNGELIEQGDSFETLLNWSLADNTLQIDLNFNSETTEGALSESTNLNLQDTTKGFLIPNPFMDLVDRDNLKEDAKTNILNAAIFGFTNNATQVYFLLSE